MASSRDNKPNVKPISDPSDDLALTQHDKPVRRPMRKILYFILKSVLTVFILYYIIDKIQVTSLKTEWYGISWFPLITGMVLTMPNVYIQHLKWKYLVRIIHPDLPNRQIFQSLMCGFSIGLVTPGRLGELGRGLYIHTDNHSPLIGLAIIDKMFSLIALALISVFGLIFLNLMTGSVFELIEYFILVMVMLFIVLLMAMLAAPSVLRYFIRLFKRAVYTMPLYKKLFALVSAADHLKKKHAAISLFYGVAFQCVIYIQFYWFLTSFTDANFFPVFLYTNLAMFLKSMLPIAVMDLGVREGAIIFFLGKMQVSSAAAFNASVLLFLSNVLLPGIIGLYYMTKYHFHKTSKH